MTFYSRSAYGSNPYAGVSRNNAAMRGWGSGWPNCQSSKQVSVSKAAVVVYVRREIAALVATLFQATETKYRYNILSGQTWGYACRAIRGTSTASNHSWGLAVDINSLSNPMQSTFKSNIPPAVVKMWEACGFYWGGRYQSRPDAMHFEYIFRPSDVARHLARARTYTVEKEWWEMAIPSSDREALGDEFEQRLKKVLNEALVPVVGHKKKRSILGSLYWIHRNGKETKAHFGLFVDPVTGEKRSFRTLFSWIRARTKETNDGVDELLAAADQPVPQRAAEAVAAEVPDTETIDVPAADQ